MSDDMSAYRDVFLSESAEYLQSMVDGLLALESNPGDLEPVETVFRGAHSLKGMAAAMGYDATADLTHRMESLMDTVRKGEQVVDSDLIDIMLRATDAVRELIDAESTGGGLPETTTVIDDLAGKASGAPGRGTPETGADAATSADAGAPPAETRDGERTYRVEVSLVEDCVLKSVRAYMVLKRLNYIGEVVDTEPPSQDIEDEKFDRAFVVELRSTQTPDQIEDAACHITDVEEVDVQLKEGPASAAPRSRTRSADQTAPRISDTQTVRVSIAHLDSLVNLVGEMVTIRSRLQTLAERARDRELLEVLEELYRVSSELQQEVMETRMVPVANIFNRFPRMVRDLARDLGKAVEFEMAGLDIELDRTVLDEIGDPIVHLLRNAIDHGIEDPGARESAGKPPAGLIRLTARRERDQVQIVVNDDGRGMNADAIWEKAIERGLCEPEERDTTTAEDILLMTCQPGFSTAKEATKVSGRGVGMDVVKGKIEYLGGSLVIRSGLGEGSEFVLTLPLTLAIIQALLVSSGSHLFAIPLGAVSEVVPPSDVTIDTVDGQPVVVLRDGELAPIYRLDVMTGTKLHVSPLPGDDEHLILLETADQTRALVVERLVGRQEIVIKPLSPVFKHMRGLSGATVLGDGRIALILDPRSFYAMGGAER